MPMIKAGDGCLAAISSACAPTCAVEFADLVVSTIIVCFPERQDAGDLLPSPVPGVSPAFLAGARLPACQESRAAPEARRGGSDGELKASMETFRAREAAMAAELASTGEHSPLAGIAGRPDAAQIRDGLPPGSSGRSSRRAGPGSTPG